MENQILEKKVFEVKMEYKFLKELSLFSSSRLKFDKYDLIERIKKLKYFVIQKYKEQQRTSFEQIFKEYQNLFSFFLEQLKYIRDIYKENIFAFDLDEEPDKIKDYVNKVYNKAFNKQNEDQNLNFKIDDIKLMNDKQIIDSKDILFKKITIYEKIFEEKINFHNIEIELLEKSKYLLKILNEFDQNDKEIKFFYKNLINDILFYIEKLFKTGLTKDHDSNNKIVKDVRVINKNIEEFDERIKVIKIILRFSYKYIRIAVFGISKLSPKILIKR